jgi:hypothetical protein
VIAAAPGWRNLAVWAMPPVAYALASDTLIGVVRTSTVDRRQDAEGPGRAAEVSLLAVLGGLALWLLRLSLAPRSTAAGFRAWVVEECPVAPGRRAARPADPGRPEDDLPDDRTTADGSSHESHSAGTAAGGLPAGTRALSHPRRPSGRIPRDGQTKTARFLALVVAEHGPLAGIPAASVARICAVSAPVVGLNAGSARTALRRAVLFAQEQQDEADKRNSLKEEQWWPSTR